ncbi:UNVERIFIED_CONTAM: hypothetical protein FKN15_034226 [Acipenser sinensis]
MFIAASPVFCCLFLHHSASFQHLELTTICIGVGVGVGGAGRRPFGCRRHKGVMVPF